MATAPETRGPFDCECYVSAPIIPEPQIGIEPMTARLRIGCSTTELLWRSISR